MASSVGQASSSDFDSASEAALVSALRAGDEEAFETLVRRYGPRMLAVARRYLGSDHDAQDALQEAFLSAFRAVGGFQGEARLATWLHRIVVNAALMKLRAARRRPERSLDDLLPRFLDDGHRQGADDGWAVAYDTAVRDRELRALVRQAIDQLPESFRAVLLLRDIEERSTLETAELTGLSESAVKTRLHRARLALRELLDPHMRREDA